MIRIVAPHFVAGLVIDPRRCAPIVKYMQSWTVERILGYCKSKGWQAQVMP